MVMRIKVPKVPDPGKINPTRAQVERALGRLGARYLETQARRIKRDMQVDGRPMRQYSRRYGQLKLEAGRTGKGQYLRVSGEMLRSQRVVVKMRHTGGRVEVGFTGARQQVSIGRNRSGKAVMKRSTRQVSNVDLARWNNKMRPFVGVTKSEQRKLSRLFYADISPAKKRSR